MSGLRPTFFLKAKIIFFAYCNAEIVIQRSPTIG